MVAISPYPTSTNSANATGLIGALVESDKPIAVNAGSFTGSNSNYNEGGGQDVGIDQVAPANIIGDEYIFVRGFILLLSNARFLDLINAIRSRLIIRSPTD